MAKIVEICEGVGFISIGGAANVGVVVSRAENSEREIHLVDSGGSADGADEILCSLGSAFAPFSLKAVVNTHSHADHAGGSARIARESRCQIWMSAGERAGLEQNLSQAAMASGGMPFPQMRSQAFVPQKFTGAKIIRPGESVAIGGGRLMRFVALPGHTFDMIGVLVDAPRGEKILFAGDGIFGRETLGKFSIPYMLDPRSFVSSLDAIQGCGADIVVPGHGAPFSAIRETVEMNKICVLETEAAIARALSREMTIDEIVAAVADEKGIEMKDRQYFLIGSTIRSFLAVLCAEGKVKCEMRANKMLLSMRRPCFIT